MGEGRPDDPRHHRPGSQHASLFATPTTQKGIAFQGRETKRREPSADPAVAAAPPTWLRLTREGDTIEAYFRKQLTDPGRLRSDSPCRTTATVQVGLAVSSHVDGTLATAHFSATSRSSRCSTGRPRDRPGRSDSYVNGTFFSATNQGHDIWGTTDAFTYIYTRWSGDGTITVR